ncbi:hypothetical protein HZ994_12255 [Akkermansiaceae bacterium]|nr:hypothetical protein HZ994_12255 [Akkermansiaceae bacterium]
MSAKTKRGEHPHIGLAVLAAGGMALGLCAGLQFLGLAARLDGLAGRMFLPTGMAEPPRPLDPMVSWLFTAAFAFALPAVILNVPGLWRRLVVWGVCIALTIAWGPVLVLAAHKPQIGVALVAVLWSGFCAMFYTTNHVLPADREESTIQPKEDGTR